VVVCELSPQFIAKGEREFLEIENVSDRSHFSPWRSFASRRARGGVQRLQITHNSAAAQVDSRTFTRARTQIANEFLKSATLKKPKTLLESILGAVCKVDGPNKFTIYRKVVVKNRTIKYSGGWHGAAAFVLAEHKALVINLRLKPISFFSRPPSPNRVA
jgi:hypothetical protein